MHTYENTVEENNDMLESVLHAVVLLIIRFVSAFVWQIFVLFK